MKCPVSTLSGCALALAVATGAALPPLTGGSARAQAIVSTGESFVSASLVLGERRASGARELGVVLELAPGWKTYWRKPGEAGIPPSFDWSRSQNVASVEVDWPRPKKFESFGLGTLGYSGRVVLPVRVTPADPAQPVALALDLALGVCDDICVLEETALRRTWTPGEAAEAAALIAAARASVPGDGRDAGLLSATCSIRGAGGTRSFEAELIFDAPVDASSVVLEGPEDTWFHDTRIASDGARIGVTAELTAADPTLWIGRRDVRITVLADSLAADIRGCSAPAG